MPVLRGPVIDRAATKTEAFEDVWKKAKTGDLFFVSGAGDLDGASALATKIGSNSPFSHIGLIIRDPTEKMWSQYGRLRAKATTEGASGAWNQGKEVPRDRQVYLWDSDWEEDGTVDGPSLRPLQEVMSDYLADDYHGTETDCIVRYLHIDDDHRKQIQDKIEDFSLEMAGKVYETKEVDFAHIKDGSFPQLAKCLWGLSSKEDLERLFCSELVAAAYRAAGLLSPTINATNFAPGHFDDRRMNSKSSGAQTSLEGGVMLSPQVRIDLEPLLYKIKVCIKDIKNLEDAKYLDCIDPFVVVKFHDRFRFKTKTIWNDRNPNFAVAFDAWYDGESDIEFEVWDKNTVHKDIRTATGVLKSACVIGKDGKEDSDPVEAPCTTFDDILKLDQEFGVGDNWAPMGLRIEVRQVPCEELVKEHKKKKKADKHDVAAQAKKMYKMNGSISAGSDIFSEPIKMTVKRAIKQAAILPGCKGFTYAVPQPLEDDDENADYMTKHTPVDVYFKTKMDNVQLPGWECYGFEEDRKSIQNDYVMATFKATSAGRQTQQFLSEKQNKWFECAVLGADGNGGLNIDINGTKIQVVANLCSTNLRPIYSPGQHAKYYSGSQHTWHECVIKDVKLGEQAHEGGIEVDVSGHSVMVDNMTVVSRLKPSTQGERGYGLGQDVEVKRSSGEWVAATITQIKPDMTLVVTMKGESISKEIPPGAVSGFLRHASGAGYAPSQPAVA